MKKTLFLITAALLAGSVQAVPILIDFENPQIPSFSITNQVIQGFRFSPSNYYQINGPQPDPTCCSQHPSNWIGWSEIGVSEGGDFGPNLDYLGPPLTFPSLGQFLWIDRGGAPFSVLGLDPASISGPELRYTSSAGGDMFSTEFDHVNFSGPQWSNINWFLVENTTTGDVITGFDNLRLDIIRTVDEPPVWALISMPLLAVMFRWRFSRFLHRKDAPRCGRVATL